jgi:hypothetical protein
MIGNLKEGMAMNETKVLSDFIVETRLKISLPSIENGEE